MQAALYIRVSTEDQVEFSPEAQKRALLEYAKKNDYIVNDEYIFIDEGISGTTAKRRPAFMRMIATAKAKPKPFDAILVHKFDRFSRSREDSIVYKSLLKRECNIKVISITEHLEDDKFSVILEAMLEAMAEYYSLNLSEEVMKGMTEKALRGQVQSVAPFGYKIQDKKLVVIPEQAEIVKLIFNKFVNEHLHCSNISRLLNNMGIKNIRGKDWEVRTVKRLLSNPAYIGVLRWNYVGRDKNYNAWIKDQEQWIIKENNHPAIIDIELFNAANKRLNEQKLTTSNRRPANIEVRHILAGLLRCDNCKGTLIYSVPNGRKPSFQCGAYRRGKCNTSNSILGDKILQEFKEKLAYDLACLKQCQFEQLHIEVMDTSSNITSTLNKKLEELDKKLEKAKKAYLAEVDTLEEYASNKAAINKEKEEVLKLLEDIPKQEAPKVLQTKVQTFLEILEDDTYSIAFKNDMLKSFIKAIYINKKEDTAAIYYYI